MFLLQTYLRRSLKHLQLTSRSFTTIEPDDQEPETEPQLPETQNQTDQPDVGVTLGSGLPAPIGQNPQKVAQSDEATQTHISVPESSGSQPVSFATSLYIDSLAQSASVPLPKDTEVMIVLDRSHFNAKHRLGSNFVSTEFHDGKTRRKFQPGSKFVPFVSLSQQSDGKNQGKTQPGWKFVPPESSSLQNGGKTQRRFLSTVVLESSLTANGDLTFNPVTSRSTKVTPGQPTGERSGFSDPMEMEPDQMEKISANEERWYRQSAVHQSEKVSSRNISETVFAELRQLFVQFFSHLLNYIFFDSVLF